MKFWRVIGVAVLIALVLQTLLNGRPTIFFALYLVLPHVVFAVLATFVAASSLRFREQGIESLIGIGVACSLVLGLLASLLGVWNDGSGITVLTLRGTLTSLVTGGILPWKDGPQELIRFFPLGVSVVFAIFAWKRSSSKIKGVGVAVGLYVVLWAAWHVLTWAAYLLRPTGFSIELAQDAFSALVRAQSSGYWTNDITNRFLAPIADQGKSVSILLQAAILYLGSICLLGGSWTKTIVRNSAIAKRFLVPEGAALIAVILGAYALGQSIRVMPRVSFTLFFVMAILLVSGICLGIWMQLRSDLENIRRDEQENPGYPLPSAAISPPEAETVSSIAGGFALLGSILLGWPVFCGFLAGFVMNEAMKLFNVSSFLRQKWPRVLIILSLACGVAWAGLAIGLQDLSPATWLIRLALGLGCIGGALILSREVWPRPAIGISVILLTAAILSGQWLIGMAAIPTLIVTWVLEFRENAQKRLILPLLGFAGWYLFTLIFFSSTFIRS